MCSSDLLAGIDDDNVVAAIDVRREAGLVLATKNHGNLCGQTTYYHVGSVDNDPLFLSGFLID